MTLSSEEDAQKGTYLCFSLGNTQKNTHTCNVSLES